MIHHISSKYHYNSSQEKGSKVAGRVLKRIRSTVDTPDKKKWKVNQQTDNNILWSVPRNDVKMFKTLHWNHSPVARGSTWVLNILMSLPWASGLPTPLILLWHEGKSPVLPIRQWKVLLNAVFIAVFFLTWNKENKGQRSRTQKNKSCETKKKVHRFLHQGTCKPNSLYYDTYCYATLRLAGSRDPGPPFSAWHIWKAKRKFYVYT